VKQELWVAVEVEVEVEVEGKNHKSQITNSKQYSMTNDQNPKIILKLQNLN